MTDNLKGDPMSDPNQRLIAWQTTSPFPLSPSYQGISGEAFALAAKVLLDKWAARGLDADVLAAIRTEVFDVAAPAP
jgi:hypothetical protein